MIEVVLTMAAGVGAGALGAMLGLGGGIFLVPLLGIGMGLPMNHAAAISLVTVIATSNFVSVSSAGRRAANPRLAMALQLAAASGAIVGLEILEGINERTQEQVFGATALLVSIVMLSRLDKRNVLDPAITDVGLLGGYLPDPDLGRDVAYRVKRAPFALTVAVAAGVISSVTGVGGGILIVPVLNSWCGVPMRAAAATSAVIIGITALPAVIAAIARGDLALPYTTMAAGAVLGVLAGSRAGFWITQRAKVRSLKILMAAILAVVALEYLYLK